MYIAVHVCNNDVMREQGLAVYLEKNESGTQERVCLDVENLIE